MKENSLFDAIRAFFVYSGDDFSGQLTRVAQYLRDNIEPQPKEKTSVDRYLQARDTGKLRTSATMGNIDSQQGIEFERELVSTETAYEGGQAERHFLQERREPNAEVVSEAVSQLATTTAVARYLEQSDSAETGITATPEVVADATVVLQTMDTENLVTNRQSVKTDKAATGDRDMEEQADLKSELPLITGVEMYLQDQLALYAEQASSTTVGEYLDEAGLRLQAAAILTKYQAQDDTQEQQLKVSSVTAYIEKNIVKMDGAGRSTGVADYLDKSAKVAESEVIIANFLVCQQALVVAALPAPSSVARYLDGYERLAANGAMSGVSAYLEKGIISTKVSEIIAGFHERMRLTQEQQQALAFKPAENRVSVVKIRHRKASGVSRYITQVDSAVISPYSVVSGVDKFIKAQALITQKQEVVDIINRCLARQDAINEQQEAPSGVARYIADVVTGKESIFAFSGVSQYLINRPAVAIIEAIPVLETSVSNYLNMQEDTDNEPRLTSKVDQYLVNQILR